ncbi:SDR family NAD(P)-dependent oxidoreductase [Marinovum algicola]|uniref:SDR family NAD(P)-dependent oxidoreductase n=1 Tax=Marinovum algicola TaxID=42444 RepID=UPI0024BAE19A|nr:SDR family oxidoreductase [Marinovum algicola]
MNPSIAKLFDLSDKSALISGATGALGAAAARALAGAGAHVTIAGGNAEKLSEIAEELKAGGAGVTMVEGRPSDEAACDALVAAACAEGRGLDILVPASGTATVKPAIEMDLETWDKVMDANVRQTWLLCRAAGKAMIDRGRGGAIIPVSSVRARFATPAGTSAYGPSKAAVDMITKSLATEWGQHDIRVNAIAPTVFRSELTAWLFEDNERANEARKGVLSRIPLGRLAEPDDFAGVLIFLASPASGLITGETINVDGGFSAN